MAPDLSLLTFLCLRLKIAVENFDIKDFSLHFLERYSGGQGKVDAGMLLNKSGLPLGLSHAVCP